MAVRGHGRSSKLEPSPLPRSRRAGLLRRPDRHAVEPGARAGREIRIEPASRARTRKTAWKASSAAGGRRGAGRRPGGPSGRDARPGPRRQARLPGRGDPRTGPAARSSRPETTRSPRRPGASSGVLLDPLAIVPPFASGRSSPALPTTGRSSRLLSTFFRDSGIPGSFFGRVGLSCCVSRPLNQTNVRDFVPWSPDGEGATRVPRGKSRGFRLQSRLPIPRSARCVCSGAPRPGRVLAGGLPSFGLRVLPRDDRRLPGRGDDDPGSHRRDDGSRHDRRPDDSRGTPLEPFDRRDARTARIGPTQPAPASSRRSGRSVDIK